VHDRGTLTLSGIDLNPEEHVHEMVITKMLRVALTAGVEGASVTAIKVHLTGTMAGSGAVVNVALWRDLNASDEVDDGDIQIAVLNFGSGDVTFSGSPLFTISAGSTERLIVRINITVGGYAGNTVGVELTSASFVTATGATTTLGLSPTGSFPLGSDIVSVVV